MGLSEAGHRHADVDVIACWYPPLVAEAIGYEIGFLEPDELSATAREALDVALASVAAAVDQAAAVVTVAPSLGHVPRQPLTYHDAP
jgi:hypothetical protein